VNTTAKTLVGASNDVKSLLVLQRLGLGLLENSVGGLTVVAGLIHGLLGAGKTGRGNNLHGLGDLLDVLDGLETALDLTQSREVGGIGRGGASDGSTTSPEGRADGTGEHCEGVEKEERAGESAGGERRGGKMSSIDRYKMKQQEQKERKGKIMKK